MDENLGLGVSWCTYVGTFDARFLEFGLGSFGPLVKFRILQFLKLLLCQFSSDSSKQGIIIIQAVTFLAKCQELQKLWHFEIFLNTGPYAAIIFKVLFLPHLPWSPSKLYDNIGYHGENTAMRTWHLVPKLTYSI